MNEIAAIEAGEAAPQATLVATPTDRLNWWRKIRGRVIAMNAEEKFGFRRVDDIGTENAILSTQLNGSAPYACTKAYPATIKCDIRKAESRGSTERFR
jgi:hypothetical protein